jgi:ETS factor family protein
LWEFIRDVLNDPRYCGKVIKWENEEEGIFRVVQSETAASMWGQKKNNRTKMTYEKMSRSIR